MGGTMSWASQGERACTMELTGDGAEWIQVKRSAAGGASSWGVEGRLRGAHYKLPDAFPTKEEAQGAALLLAIRLSPTRRGALHVALNVVPGAWWWRITPADDASAEDRSVYSSRVADSEESAERSGRAAGGGWWLNVYGPGTVRVFGKLPR
jgi:hypothetical protein